MSQDGANEIKQLPKNPVDRPLALSIGVSPLPPHIVVVYDDWKAICGRGAVAFMGHERFMIWIYSKHFWKPKIEYRIVQSFNEKVHYDTEFPLKYELFATIHHKLGGADEAPIRIDRWAGGR
ncbi:uncharacterized protein BXZ73DRAFT_81458 [Epithele typhae]|uniref:uncharacterized protein n=1 Tax=Epithele typhae TaxID=378194 RepID=UPI002007275D|nr:uncharacterized protein BXZ73DRAFT_81458 [Epithele typhae]KAH9915025.1 hypothetical protein BXZ73DRAFT_81458 [Epithele typhae]